MGRHHHPLLKTFVVLSVLTATRAAAYPTPVDFDGSLMRWSINGNSDPITYGVEADLELDKTRFEGLIDQAADLWTAVPESYFVYTPVEPGLAPQVTINLKRALDGSAFSAGYAIFDEYDGDRPKHCSIFVVIDDGLSDDAMGKTFLHELGHCLGLGHTLIPQAIMSYQLDKNTFALDLDDEAALTRLYPVDGSGPKLPPGCAVGAFGAFGAEASYAAMTILIALPLLAALLQRKRIRFDRR